MKNNGIKRLLSLVLSGAMIISFAACAKKEEPQQSEPENPNAAIELMEGEADKAGSMWELVCRMFPGYVIYKDALNSFTYHNDFFT